MREYFSRALPDNPMNLGFLLLFVVIFVGIVAYWLRPSTKPTLDQDSQLPLND